MKYISTKSKATIFGFLFMLCWSTVVLSQLPTVTTRFANPHYDCTTGQYCLDVEFISDTDGIEIFGMNVRLFIDGEMMELAGFSDFQGGYGPVSPDPPDVITSGPGIGNSLFGFGDPGTGIADFINGAIQLLDDSQPAILLSTTEWVKLFQICFTIEDPNIDSSNFCPPVVWDLEQDPANDGFLVGDDGVVITLTDPDPMVMSQPSNENVVQFNWQYIGDGSAPYGEPVEIECISLECVPTIVCAPDITIECDESTEPLNTGEATAEEVCSSEITITFSDVTVEGSCDQAYTISRQWIATNTCGLADTCVQTITISDTTVPGIVCPADVTIDCTESTEPGETGLATATDNCDSEPSVTYSDVTIAGACAQEYTLIRTWVATDDCLNTSTCSQSIVVEDNEPPSITCPADATVSCVSMVPPVDPGSITASDNCDGNVLVIHGGDVNSNVICANQFTITRTYIATDACGNSSTCTQIILVNDQTPPVIGCPADVTVSCTSEVPPVNTSGVFVNENCAGVVTVTHEGDVISNESCANQYTIMRQYQATDACGFTATCIQIIIVNDQTAPSITCPVNVTVSCASEVPVADPGSVTTSDNCGGTVQVTHLGDVVTNQTCADRFTVTRTYLAADECGNSATCVQVITVNDQTGPMLSCPVNVTVSNTDSTDPQSTGMATASDNCGGTASLTFSDMIVEGMCDEEYTINRTWTATDVCGNTSTCLQTIMVVGGCIVDLALEKVLADGQSTVISGGDNVTFTITVINEGEVDISAVTIIDYIPLGFTLNDPDWTAGNAGSTGQSATITLSIANGGLDPNGLNPGESVSVDITLQANADIAPGVYTNTAEILFVLDINGNDISGNDIDSDPDDDDTNDPPDEDDIDSATICVLPQPVITGDAYVCPGETTTYSVQFIAGFTYLWSVGGGGIIVANNGSSIDVQWPLTPGGPFEVSVVVSAGPGCSTTAFFNVYIQGVETLTCNNHVNLSIDVDCESQVLSGMILEGEAEGNDNYFVEITDQNGNIIPNATLTFEHIGQTFIVTVRNECNDQSCWGLLTVEDKLPPVIECMDVVVPCGTSTDPVFDPPTTGSVVRTVTPGSAIGPNAGMITTATIEVDLPSNAQVSDINVTIDLDHTWSADLNVVLISPAGTSITLANAVCGSADNWDNVTFDDQASTPVAAACNVAPPPALLQGFVIPQEALATFNGEFADGVWTLQITDLVNGDGGTLNLVSLNISYVLSLAYAPIASDACGVVTLTYTESESGNTCETITLTRVWTATDGSGNTATCVQNITVLPLDLEDIGFPDTYLGECGDPVSPHFTGWPTVNGQEVTDQNALCNIFVGYWDKELVECGGGRKILRSWTVLDWCTLELVEGTQIIKLTDTEPPVLSCPQNIVVGTDFWYCYANVSIPKPTAYDECSLIASYSLTSTGGTIIPIGNNFVINGLELGTYTVTWTVTDECGNSSTCSFQITVVDNVVPVAICDEHTVVSLTNDGPFGVTLIPASVFDDGSYDNCGPVTFRARRFNPENPGASSCIDFDWTTEGACIDDIPGGIPPVNSRDHGTVHRPCVPFACCDVGAGPVMVELEVTDVSGNRNFCMVEVIVQDKISPFILCPPDIIVSCDFWFNVQEGLFSDVGGNNNGNLDEDPLTSVFGNMYDAFRYHENARQNIVIFDPGNPQVGQPHHWGLDGWADDNCEVNLTVRVIVTEDCSGGNLPANAPPGAVKLIERRFSASDGNQGIAPGTCTQRIWVVDFDPFVITDTQCGLVNADDVRWPCDIHLTTCPEGGLTPDDLEQILPVNQRINSRPQVNDDACSLIGINYEDTRFDFVDGSCFKILRKWSIIDWCQYNAQTGYGLWHYTQVIKVHDEEGPIFVDPCVTQTLCVADPGVSLPDNNQAFLGEDNPLSSSCSVHLNLSRTVLETCSDVVRFDVKIYLFNGPEFIQVQSTTSASVDEHGHAVLTFDTRQSGNQSVRLNGIPYNSPQCGNYHRILWSAEDGCGNWSHCEYLLRLEDCKQPSPVCINGLSTVLMPVGGQVTIWAKDFDASSFDDCTPAADLLYSFSGTTYQPSFTYTCENVPSFGVELSTQIWVADGGVDHNCNGVISWDERNKDFCTTTIVILDNTNVCGSGPIVGGEILTEKYNTVEKVEVALTAPGHFFPTYVTATDGKFTFTGMPLGQSYTIAPVRNDNHKNGVSTLDLVYIQKHLLGLEPFTSPYQYIAADANNSQHVSAIDLVEIRKLILGIYNQFPQNKSWRFVQKGYEMTPDHPWPFEETIELPAMQGDNLMDNDFVAIKVGDVNHTAKASLTQVQPRDSRRVMPVWVSVSREVTEGEMVEMVMTLPGDVAGFQWTLETGGLEFVGISSEDIAIDEQHIGLLGNGIVTMSWNGTTSQASAGKGEITFVMLWKATTSGMVSSMIHMSDLITTAEAYTDQDEIMDVKLAFEGRSSEADFALYQNRPNPWNGQTTIGFDLPVEGMAVLSVFDVTGKEVYKVEGQYAAGYNTVTLHQKDLPATGVMYYRLDSGEYSASKKMVLIP